MRTATILLLSLLGLLFTAMPAHAARSYDGCTAFITSLPTTINGSGTYCFKQDLTMPSTTGAAITIVGESITLDCNDFRLDGLAAGPATNATGIFAQYVSNVTVRHCSVGGFQVGIDVEVPNGISGGSNLIEDNHLDGNTNVGITMTGYNSTVRRNVVLDTGGSTLVPGTATGISAAGDVDVYDNTISGLVTKAATPEIATGISFGVSNDADIFRNHISGISTSASGVGYGIYLYSVTRAVVRENDITGATGGYSHAIVCTTFTNDRLRKNIAGGFTDLSLGTCSDAGENDFTP